MPDNYWTTKDYFDPFPGIQAGLAMRRQRESENQFREAQKQHALDRAAEDQYKSQQLAMEAGKLSAAFGVDPVMDASGRFDPIGTAKSGVLRKATDESAAGLALKHAQIMDSTGMEMFWPTPEERKLMEEPAYKKALGEAQFKFQLEHDREEARRRAAAAHNYEAPPKVAVAEDGSKWYVNPVTGKSDPIPEKSDTAKSIKDENGNVVGYEYGKKTWQRQPTIFDQPQELQGTNAPAPMMQGDNKPQPRKFSRTGARLQ